MVEKLDRLFARMGRKGEKEGSMIPFVPPLVSYSFEPLSRPNELKSRRKFFRYAFLNNMEKAKTITMLSQF